MKPNITSTASFTTSYAATTTATLSQIKWIALICMFIDHFAIAAPNPTIHAIMRGIGRIAFITFGLHTIIQINHNQNPTKIFGINITKSNGFPFSVYYLKSLIWWFHLVFNSNKKYILIILEIFNGYPIQLIYLAYC